MIKKSIDYRLSKVENYLATKEFRHRALITSLNGDILNEIEKKFNAGNDEIKDSVRTLVNQTLMLCVENIKKEIYCDHEDLCERIYKIEERIDNGICKKISQWWKK